MSESSESRLTVELAGLKFKVYPSSGQYATLPPGTTVRVELLHLVNPPTPRTGHLVYVRTAYAYGKDVVRDY